MTPSISVPVRFWRLGTLVAVCALMLVLVHGAAADDAPAGTESTSETISPQAVVTGRASGLGNVFTKGSNNSIATTSTTLERLTSSPGLLVPVGQKQRFVVRFSGEATCRGPVRALCSVRVKVGGNVPFPGRPLIFAETLRDDPTQSDFANNSVEYVTACLDPGRYPVTVDYVVGQATGTESTEFRFLHWLLVVEQLNNCS